MEMQAARVSPQALYHAVWCAVADRFYNRARLRDWDFWAHRFDHVMRTEEDAYRCIGEMLSSLQDTYTHLKVPQVVHADFVALQEEPSPVSATMLQGGIGYIHIRTFAHKHVAEEVANALVGIRRARAFILRLSGNRGGFIVGANNVASMFLDRGPLMITRSCEDGIVTEKRTWIDSFHINEAHIDSEGRVIGKRRWERYPNYTGNKPLYVLIDNQTCSAAEMVAGILFDHKRATFVGSTTAGKGICQETLPMPNECALKCTTGVYLTPSGHWFGDDAQTCAYGMHPHIRAHGDDAFDVAFNRLSDQLYGRRTGTGSWLLAGAIGLGLALYAGTAGGGRRAA